MKVCTVVNYAELSIQLHTQHTLEGMLDEEDTIYKDGLEQPLPSTSTVVLLSEEETVEEGV